MSTTVVKTVKEAQGGEGGLKLSKRIKRLTVLVRDSAGEIHAESYKAKKKRKKGSRGTRAPERLTRESARSVQTILDAYLDRHRRSNRKRRDGWLRDYGDNVMRASRKGFRKFKLRKVLSF